MTTADQIRAAATAAINNPAPSIIPGAATSDQVQPAPNSISLELQVTQLQAQLAQALAVISSLKPAAVAVAPGKRTYHSGPPFVKIHVMRAPGSTEAFQFRGHKLETDDPAVIAFMEAAIASGGSGFSHAPIPNKPTAEEVEMRADVMNSAVIARDKMVKAGEPVA